MDTQFFTNFVKQESGDSIGINTPTLTSTKKKKERQKNSKNRATEHCTSTSDLYKKHIMVPHIFNMWS